MRATKVTFGRTVSQNYQSRHVSVELEIEKGEKVEDALCVAKALVAKGLGESPSKGDVEKAREVLAQADLEERIGKL